MNARVLSIQSHVVTGYVGNKSATFPMQLHGYDVDPLNTVHFSNHTGFPHWRGERTTAAQILDIISGLEVNGFLDRPYYTHLLSGYVGAPESVHAVVEVVKRLRRANPSLLYVCDPVMGDNGKMYVREDVLPVYRDQLLALADVITPNQYEAELLAGRAMKTAADVHKVLDILHSKGVRNVVITSLELGAADGNPEDDANMIMLVGSCGTDGRRFAIRFPKLCGYFTGTGDLFAALIIAFTRKSFDLPLACEKAVAVMQSVLNRTLAHVMENARADDSEEQRWRNYELKLIQSRDDISHPQILHRASDFTIIV